MGKGKGAFPNPGGAGGAEDILRGSDNADRLSSAESRGAPRGTLSKLSLPKSRDRSRSRSLWGLVEVLVALLTSFQNCLELGGESNSSSSSPFSRRCSLRGGLSNAVELSTAAGAVMPGFAAVSADVGAVWARVVGRALGGINGASSVAGCVAELRTPNKPKNLDLAVKVVRERRDL